MKLKNIINRALSAMVVGTTCATAAATVNYIFPKMSVIEVSVVWFVFLIIAVALGLYDWIIHCLEEADRMVDPM